MRNWLTITYTLLILLAAPAALKAQVSRFDAQATDWATTQPVKLAGEWEFYPNQLLTPIELAVKTPKGVRVAVPNGWDAYTVDAKPFGTHGYGTYRTQVLLGPNHSGLALQVPFIWTSYRVFVNGQLAAVSGKPGTSAAETQSKMLRQLVRIPDSTDRLDIVIQVADYSLFGGMLETPTVGRETQLRLAYEFGNSRDLAIIGGLLVMAIYHFLVYLFRRKERAMLWFGLICLTVLLRYMVFADHYIYFWLNEYSGFYTFAWQVKGYYLLTLALVVQGAFYLRALFPLDMPRRAAQGVALVAGLYTLAALFLPIATFTETLVGLQVVLMAVVVGLLYVMLRAAWFHRPYARALSVGLLGMVAAGLHDVLQLAGYGLVEYELLTYGFLFFLAVQAIVLSRRYGFALTEAEDLSANLELKVTQRTEELNHANQEISQKNRDITDSIEYARRIQLSILPKTDAFYRAFPQAFVLYLPKDIVSGDFYWLHEQQNSFYVCAADCTGHGVPGAFMSMLGSNLLNRLVSENELPCPSELLNSLDQLVQEALKQNQTRREREDLAAEGSQDGMDLNLCRFDRDRQQLVYAGANRPLLRLRNGEMEEFAPTKQPIGGGASLYGDRTAFARTVIDVQPGDTFYLFTDGITDQFGGDNNRKFTSKRFRTLLQETAQLDLPAQKQHLHNELKAWQADRPQTDDILVIAIRIP